MTRTAAFLLITVYMSGTVLCQVSFSTHWGTGKRSQIFDNSQQPMPSVFTDNSDNLVQCLSKMEFNILRFMSILLEKELKQARQCLMSEKQVDYE